eukprot:TRINITY_DN25998_c0_g1_i7.p2 TRINITY_DN25998_c0_g1~~TRINITY_DN25998_c0_g1_i7.p2  ORF type:complete len:152 (+),score=19.51 TRINITY_DN25998_c0_g1_i7:95-550(+)
MYCQPAHTTFSGCGLLEFDDRQRDRPGRAEFEHPSRRERLLGRRLPDPHGEIWSQSCPPCAIRVEENACLDAVFRIRMVRFGPKVVRPAPSEEELAAWELCNGASSGGKAEEEAQQSEKTNENKTNQGCMRFLVVAFVEMVSCRCRRQHSV